MAGVLTRLVGYRSHGVTACSLWLSHCPPSIPGPPLPTCASATVSSLLAKQFCHLQSTGLQPPRSAPRLSHILSGPVSSPLNSVAWQQALAPHPDRKWVEALLQGIRQGFRLGLQPDATCRSSRANHPSATSHAQVVSQYLAQQVSSGYMLGPIDPALCEGVVISSLGVVPKSTPGKFRVIVDLSSPSNHAVNDQLHREWSHVAYASVDDAALLLHALGPGAQMAKLDIRDAYRIVPIHPEERVFLGVQWQGHVYIDCQLPFGLASAPAIFNALADALEWILRQRGIRAVIHYLDDFLILGAPGSPECSQALATTLSICAELGVPLAPDKVEGPAYSITFLGISLHSLPLQISLPAHKQAALLGMLGNLVDARCIRDVSVLESLVGHLVHATKVCPLGKAFLSGLFQALRRARHGSFWRLNVAVRADLAWWQTLLQSWSGVSSQQFLVLGTPGVHLFTDASGSWGCGALTTQSWLQVAWPEGSILSSIALKELVPVTLALSVWGHRWTGQLVLCHSDNMAVVGQLNSLHAQDPLANNMLRCIALLQARFDFRLRAAHIPGSLNVAADLLSRGRQQAFMDQYPSFSPFPTQVPQTLINLLCWEPADWTSLTWRTKFSDFWMQGWLTQPAGSTALVGPGTWPSLGHSVSHLHQ